MPKLPLLKITTSSILVAMFFNPSSFPLAIALVAFLSLKIAKDYQAQFQSVSLAIEEIKTYELAQANRDEDLAKLQAEVARLATLSSFQKSR